MLLCCMKTVKDVFVAYHQGLDELYSAPEAEAITLVVLTDLSGQSSAKIKAFPEQEIPAEIGEQAIVILDRLKTGEPVQYIIGHTEFCGLPFKVNPTVLIPRPETEELVAWTIESAGSWQWAVSSGQLAVGSDELAVGSEQWAVGSGQWAVDGRQFAGKILDIGTGSGCIAISLKKNLPNFQVSAIDISVDAMQTAKENAQLNNVDVDFINGDILNPEQPFTSDLPIAIGTPLTTRYSLIISNPPYVTLHDKTLMHKNVTEFEPHTALFVPEADPLVFYKAIAVFATNHLTPGGLLFFEINESYGKELVSLLMDKGFKNIELKKDMSGRDRMIKATLN